MSRMSLVFIDELADGGNNVNIVYGLVSEAPGKKSGFFGVRQFLVHYIDVFPLYLAQSAFGIDAGCPEILLGHPYADSKSGIHEMPVQFLFFHRPAYPSLPAPIVRSMASTISLQQLSVVSLSGPSTITRHSGCVPE